MFTETKQQILHVLETLNKEERDFKGCFLTPAGYTLIKTYITKNRLDYSSCLFSNDTLSFLDVLGLFDGKSRLKINTKNVLPFRTINSQDDSQSDDINSEFRDLIDNFGNFSDSLMDLVGNIIGELLNNVCHHSGEQDYGDDTGEVIISTNYHSGQFFENKSYIQVAIVDTGIGILSSVRSKLPEIQYSRDAIKKALEARFTGGTVLDGKNKNFPGIYNGGIGLTVTHEILKRVNGDLFIGTKDCLFSYSGVDKIEEFNEIPTWKGTFVIFNIYTDNITDVDFSSLRGSIQNSDNNDLIENIDFS